MLTYGRTLLYYALLFFISPLMANDDGNSDYRKVIESPLYNSDNKLNKKVEIHPALIYGEVDFHLKPNDNDPLLTTYEFTIPTISQDQFVKMRRAFILLPHWDLRTVNKGSMISAKGKEIPYPSQSLMLNIFSRYLKEQNYVRVLVEEQHGVPKYIEYRCQKPAMPFSVSTVLNCELHDEITMTENVLTAEKLTAPYHLLETIVSAAHTQTRDLNQVPNGIINKDITINFKAYHRHVTEAEYNIQTEAIYTAASNYNDYIEKTEPLPTQSEIEQVQKELEATKLHLDRCNKKNLDHEQINDDLIKELDALKQKMKELH